MRRALYCIALFVLLAGCSARQDPAAPVRDLVELQQDTGAYHHLAKDVPLLTEAAQEQSFTYFLAKHFGPWERETATYPAEQVFWPLSSYKGKTLFGENTLPRDPGWLSTMAQSARVDAYPSMARKAIAVTNTSLRSLPTNAPAFLDFQLAGEGYPFDYMQNSLVLAGTPLLATHASADGEFVLVESRHAFGWVAARDIGWVDDGFIKRFRAAPLGAVTVDDTPVWDNTGTFAFSAEVGMLLPLEEGGVLIPLRGLHGNAMLVRGTAPMSGVEQAPISPTPANFARVANTMLGRPYGWGGYLGNRDCSAMTMDLMATFGIYLPRNSSQQARQAEFVDLSGLDRKTKKARINSLSTPFLTLIRKPGHIMLYIGDRDGDPVVLHAAWGLKTKTGDGYGRKIMGATVVTTLEPGKELKDLARPEGLYIETVTGITTLP